MAVWESFPGCWVAALMLVLFSPYKGRFHGLGWAAAQRQTLCILHFLSSFISPMFSVHIHNRFLIKINLFIITLNWSLLPSTLISSSLPVSFPAFSWFVSHPDRSCLNNYWNYRYWCLPQLWASVESPSQRWSNWAKLLFSSCFSFLSSTPVFWSHKRMLLFFSRVMFSIVENSQKAETVLHYCYTFRTQKILSLE